MRNFKFFVIGLIFAANLSAVVIAQTQPNSAPNKIVFIDTKVFEDKTSGIKEVVEADDKIEAELKPQADELKSLFEEYKAAVDEIKKTTPPPSAPYFYNCFAPPIEDKIDSLEKLQVKIENKQEEAKKLYEKRKLEILADVHRKISESIKRFLKEKGYSMILDSSKTDSSMIIEGKIIDVTEEFIQYYNENFAKTKTQTDN